MEEAYSELYQQFIRLKSLCLRQAALLHQLTTALQQQQGAPVTNGESSDMFSIPIQCTQEIPSYLLHKPGPKTATAHGAAHRPRNVGTFSDLLADDMFKLHVDSPRQTRENHKQNVAPLLSVGGSCCQGASSRVSENLLQADHFSGGKTMHTVQMPVRDSPCLVGDFQSQTDGLLMSEVALQSHVCEFCQAVFPGDTTTRGEFLRHLCTHVT